MSPSVRRVSEEGATLILAVLIMTAVLAFGMSYAATSATYLEIQLGTYNRAQSRGIAEGGLEVGHRKLLDSPTFRGNLGPTTVGDGSYTVSIVDNGSYVDVTSEGTVSSFTSSYMSRFTVGTHLCIEDTFYIGGDFFTDGSTPAWARTVKYFGNLYILDGGTFEGSKEQGIGFRAIGIDTAAFAAIADNIYPDGQRLNGAINGNIFIAGSGSIDGPTTLTGMLCVDGDFDIGARGGGPVELLSASEPTVLLVTGNLTVHDINVLVVAGSIFVMGDVTFTNLPSFNGLGSVVANGNLGFIQSGGSWEYDAAIYDDPPTEVTGGPRCIEVVELWRYPTGFVKQTEGGGDDGGGGDDDGGGGGGQETQPKGGQIPMQQ